MRKSWGDKVALIEDIIAGIFLLMLAIVPISEIVVRRVSGSGFIWSNGFLTHVVVWISWLGGIIASRENVHLSLSSGPEPTKAFWKAIDTAKAVAIIAINMAFAIASAAFLVWGFGPRDEISGVPIRLILIILPIGYFSMSLRALWRPRKKPSAFLWLGLLVGVVFAWASVVSLIEAASSDIPEFLYKSQDLYWAFFRWARWPLIILIILLAIRGLPIYILLGGTALLLFAGNRSPLAVLPNEAYNLLTGNIIPAIPLFTFAGFLLSQGSAGKRLVRFFQATLGWLPGGLAVVTVVACAYFTTFTGASGVTILALGGLLSSVLVESRQYGRDFSRGLITSSGSVGLLFPPALPIIMYGVVAQVSIRDMFLGGLLPGTLLVLVLSGMGMARAFGYKKERVPFVFSNCISSLKMAIGDLLLPVVLLVSYFTGITTVVETAALAVVYSLILTLVAGELTLELILKVLRRGVPVIGGVLVILAMAKGLSYFIIDAQVPTMLTAFFRENVSSRFVFLILLNLALLLTGTLMDIYSAILVMAPLIIPLGTLYNVHPVQLGIIFLANLQLGYLTPPVGMNLFLASYTFEEPMMRIYRQVLPFFIVLLIAVLLITYVPWFSLALLGE